MFKGSAMVDWCFQGGALGCPDFTIDSWVLEDSYMVGLAFKSLSPKGVS